MPGLLERVARALLERVGELLVEAGDAQRNPVVTRHRRALSVLRRARRGRARRAASRRRTGAPGGAGCARACRAWRAGTPRCAGWAACTIGIWSVTDSPWPGKPGDLLRIVGQDADAGESEVDEDLRADAVVAQVRRQPEPQVRLDRVEPLLLQLVGAQLVEQPDAAPLLAEVEQHAPALGLDHRQRRLELLAAVAAQRVEDIAGEALGVHAHEHVLRSLDVALDERDVVLAVEHRAVADRDEVAERRRQPGRDDALDELLGAPPVGDQVGHRDHLQAVAGAVLGPGPGRAPSCRRRS